MKRITIKDLAEYARVSRGTVDRVLHNRGGVNTEAKERVDHAIKVLSYVPNILARTLVQNNLYRIGVLIPSPEKDPFWQFAQVGVNKAISAIQDYGITHIPYFFDSEDPRSFEFQAKQILKDTPDAILLAPEFYTESMDLLSHLSNLNIPTVLINTMLHSTDICGYVGQDSFQAGLIAGRLFDTTLHSKTKKIVVLNLGPTAANAIHLLNKEKGLRESFADQPDTVILNHEIVDFKNQILMRREIKNILSHHPDINGIMVSNSRSKYVAEIIDEVEIPEEFCFIGFDLLPENVHFLKKGTIDFLLNQNPEKQAEIAIKRIADLLMFSREKPFEQHLPLDIVIKENVSYYLSQESEPWVANF